MTIAALGYVGFKASDLVAWSEFATKVLGLMAAEAPDDVARFRMDAQAWRIAVEPGEEDDVAYLGFEVSGPDGLAVVVERLRKADVAFAVADPDLLKLRGVVGLVTCHDPDGLAVEIYYGPTERRETPFVSPAGVSAFLTGEQGLGHVVLATKNITKARRFYSEILGFQLSDIIHMQLSPEFGMDLEFYHCNPRHHTLALAPAPASKRLHHFMLQTATLDDVGFALDRVRAAKIHLSNTLGKHSNDLMVSFYAQTPSGFDVEYGWGAREIEQGWRVVRHDRTSIWGHHRQH